jgi:hypothetical protein
MFVFLQKFWLTAATLIHIIRGTKKYLANIIFFETSKSLSTEQKKSKQWFKMGLQI